jgi:hypothetical protein
MTDYLLMALGIIVTMLGYFLTRLSNDIKELEHNMTNCQTDLPRTFVLKDDYKNDMYSFKKDMKEDIAEIKHMIGKLFDKANRGSK